MTSDKPALQVREETQSGGLNMLDIISDKRALAAGALTALGVAGVMYHLKPEILQSVATDAKDLFESLNGKALQSQIDELGGMSGGATMFERDMLNAMGVSGAAARFERLSGENMDMSGAAARFERSSGENLNLYGAAARFERDVLKGIRMSGPAAGFEREMGDVYPGMTVAQGFFGSIG